MAENLYGMRMRASDHDCTIDREGPVFHAMFELFTQIGIFWKNTPQQKDAATGKMIDLDLKSEVYAFMMNRIELNSFYAMEYLNAKEVLDEFKANASSVDEAYAAFFTDPNGTQNPPKSRLSHARQYVSNELIALQLTLGGFAAFGAKNYPGFIGGAYIEGKPAPYRTPKIISMEKKVDYLIIGSGVAGAAISSKILNENPKASILMLEAGTKVEMRDFATYQDYVVTGNTPYAFCQDENYPQHDTPGENKTNDWDLQLRGARLMTYGGSTVHWGGWSFRLKPEDFKLKTNTGHGIDWPIDYNTLEDYYSQAEHYIGVAGNSESDVVPRNTPYPYPAYPYTLEDQPLRDALEYYDYSHDNMPIARHGINDTDSPHAPCQTTGTCKYCPFGARYVAANYLDDMKRFNDYPNFEIRTQAFVKEIVMDSESKAGGVTYIDRSIPVNNKDKSRNLKTVTADKIIVAAGSIESAKLLLRSKSKKGDFAVGNEHDLVGRNLITHPYFIYQARIKSNSKALQPEMNFPTMVSRHFDSEAEQEQGKFILVSTPSAPVPVDDDGKSMKIMQMMQEGMDRESIDEQVVGDAIVQIHGIIEVFSEFENRVQNLDEVNHLGLIETEVKYKKPETFNDRINYVKEKVDELFERMEAVDSKQYMMSWRADHAACLTRMSDDPKEGVVDKNLKVHGIDNLYVCSNASFSSLGAVNPTLTLTALSLRLGDHLNALK